MECLTDYEILNDDSLSSRILAKHKSTGQLYHIEGLPFGDFSDNEKKTFTKKIKNRIDLSHPNVVQFYGYTQYNNVLYLKQEYCKYGTIEAFVQTECIDKGKQLHETLLCRLLYQIAFALKTLQCLLGDFNSTTVLLDEDFQIKLYNFLNVDEDRKTQAKQKEVKMHQLGVVLFELSVTKKFEKSRYESDVKHQQNYSESFKNLLISMIKDHTEAKKHLNRILCHPLVLLKSNKWVKEQSFLERPPSNAMTSIAAETRPFPERLEQLKRREAALLLKEQILGERERKVVQKEKHLRVLERNLKARLQQAELHLKRGKESKNSIQEENEVSYVSCEDTELVSTSSKLHVDKIAKPHNFTRTLSERRITFKTSPLKERNLSFTKKKSATLRRWKVIEENELLSEQQKPSKESSIERRRSLFLPSAHETDLGNSGWNAETKKCAFEMLRLMNENEKENRAVKHTDL